MRPTLSNRLPFTGCLIALTLAFARPRVDGAYLDLTNYDSIEIDYRSTGCFHHTHYRFLLSPGSAFPIVKIFNTSAPSSFADKSDSKTSSELLGTYELTAEEWIGLERLFTYYQKEPLGVCTTQDFISVRFHHGKEMIENTYRDSSCGAYDIEPVTTFHDLIEAIPIVAIRQQAKKDELDALTKELQKLKLPDDHNPIVEQFESEGATLESALEQLHSHVPDLNIALSSSIAEKPVMLKLQKLELNRILDFLADRLECEWVFSGETIHFIDPTELNPEARDIDALILQKNRIQETIQKVTRRPRF